MKIFVRTYIFLFLIAITLDLYETMDAAQVCVDVPDFGRVCIPVPASEMNSDIEIDRLSNCPTGILNIDGQCLNPASEIPLDFGNTRLKNCPTGMMNIGGLCFLDPARLLSKLSSNIFEIPHRASEINADFGTGRLGVDSTKKDNCPMGMVSLGRQCIDPRDCPHGCGGGGAVSAPCPKGTRADQYGNCRQKL